MSLCQICLSAPYLGQWRFSGPIEGNVSVPCRAFFSFPVEQKVTEVAATSSSTNVPIVLPPNPDPQPPTESEDPTLGKRKASQITTDTGAVPSVTQKRKRRRKVGPDQSIPAADTSTIEVAPPDPEIGQGVVPGDATHDAAGSSAVGGANQGTTSPTQKKKRRKKAGVGQSDPTPVEPMGQHIEPPTEPTNAPEPPPVEPARTRKRKTIVLDLSTVIQPSAAAQVRLGSSVCGVIDLWDVFGEGLSVYFSNPTILTRGRAFTFYNERGYQKAPRKEEGQGPGGASETDPHHVSCSSPKQCRRTCLVQHETETARQ